MKEEKVEIDKQLYLKLKYLGIIPSSERSYNVGASDYSEQDVQPWSVWLAYPHLTSWDHDIIKRICRTKETETDSRRMDYEKIIHICKERIRQIDALKELADYWNELTEDSIAEFENRRHG